MPVSRQEAESGIVVQVNKSDLAIFHLEIFRNRNRSRFKAGTASKHLRCLSETEMLPERKQKNFDASHYSL